MYIILGWVFYINIYLKTSYRDKIEAADFNLVVDKLRARYGTAQVTISYRPAVLSLPKLSRSKS